ncbi:MAG: response regulator [Candidatus Latescibacteria bacterium]|nr:response regulator [Candidatus Latescibacterota bacterium]
MLVFTLLVAGISLFIYFYFPGKMKEQAYELIIDEAHSITEIAAFSISPALLFEDNDTAEEMLAGVKNNNDILYIVIVNQNGEIFYAFNLSEAEKYNFRNKNEFTQFNEVYKISYPVKNNNLIIGTFHVGFSTHKLLYLVKESKNTIKMASIFIFSFGVLAVFIISLIITSPLESMARTVQQIAKGDLKQRASIKSNDEIGDFAKAFNCMVDTLEASYQQLENFNKNLENRVRERTKLLISEFEERKKAEEEAQKSYELVHTIISNTPLVITAVDKNGIFTYSEGKGLEKMGVKPNQIVGQSAFEVFKEHSIILDNIRKVLEGNSFQYTIELRHLVFETWYEPLKDSKGEITGAISVSVDITDKKRLEIQFLQAQKMETVGRLAGGVAHDFNNILTVITGNAEIALMSLSPDNQLYSDISVIRSSAHRAANLIRQLLAFSRRQIIKPVILNLNTTLLDMDKMLRRLIGEDIEYVTLPADNLWNVNIDPGQIEQVLTNLIVNARDAMPMGGKLTIETANVTLDKKYIELHRYVEPGEYVMLAVSDNGEGMDEEIKTHIFEPFYTTKEVGKGTGLGLSTCYGIVKQNKGNIWVYSEPGHGTTIKVYLPKVHEKEATSINAEKLNELPVGAGNILVVEDESMVRHMVVRTLEGKGYTVFRASNGEEALRIIKNEKISKIDLLITDVIMPIMGGKELFTKLSVNFPDIKVLYMSGYTDDSIVHHGVLESGLAFLQKPFSPSVMVRKVQHILTH